MANGETDSYEVFFAQWQMMGARVRNLGDIVQNPRKPTREEIMDWKHEFERMQVSLTMLAQQTFHEVS